jgi:tol-pal system protein YbgF
MHRSIRMAVATLALASSAVLLPQPAFAANKDMVQLQTQVQQLQDAVARLQQSNDERIGVMKDLVQQATDSVNKMSAGLEAMQRQMRTQADASGKNAEQISGQVQSLNDSIDELKARLGRMEKTMADLQSSQQSIGARLDSGAPAGGATAPSTSAPDTLPAPVTTPSRTGKPSAAIPAAPIQSPVAAPPAAPPVEDLYRTAYGDFNSAKYALASAEFNDVIKFYPDSNLAGNAYFYLGEVDYKAGRFGPASKNYDKVIEQYPGNSKAAVAQLRKGESLMQLKQTDAGTRELRSLIQRYPNSQEAVAARSKLNSMGITIAPRAAR